jgi:hypothetical protein
MGSTPLIIIKSASIYEIKMGFFKEFFTEIAIRVKNPGKNKYCHPKYTEFVPRELPNPIKRQPVYTPLPPLPPVYTPPRQEVYTPRPPVYTPRRDYIQPQPKQDKNCVTQRDYIQPKQVKNCVTPQRQQDYIQPKRQQDYIQPKRQRVQPDLRRAWLLD